MEKDQCEQCGRDFDWEDEIWVLNIIPEHRGKSHNCQCGVEYLMTVPSTPAAKQKQREEDEKRGEV